jgi:hypothetical protein
MTNTSNNQKSSRRWVFIATTFVAFFSCCGAPLYSYLVLPQWNKIRAERLKTDLQEQLPDGSTREQAEAWFATRGLETSDLMNMADRRRCGLHATIIAGTSLYYQEIHVYVYLDDNGKVRAREVFIFRPSL